MPDNKTKKEASKGKSQDSGNYEVGYKKPPKNRQFGEKDGNPRGHGFFDVNDTPRAKLEKMMKLSEPELKEIVGDKDRPYFERKLAMCIHKGEWNELQSMINQVYGTPVQKFEGAVELPAPLVDLTKRKKK